MELPVEIKSWIPSAAIPVSGMICLEKRHGGQGERAQGGGQSFPWINPVLGSVSIVASPYFLGQIPGFASTPRVGFSWNGLGWEEP